MRIGICMLIAKHLLAIVRIFAKALSYSHLLLNIGGKIRHTMLVEEMRIVVLQAWDWVCVDDRDIFHHCFCGGDSARFGEDYICRVHQHRYLVGKTNQT